MHPALSACLLSLLRVHVCAAGHGLAMLGAVIYPACGPVQVWLVMELRGCNHAPTTHAPCAKLLLSKSGCRHVGLL